MRFFSLLLTFVSLPLVLRADLVVVQDVEAMGQKMTMTMKTKGTLLRMDMNPQMSVIMDTSSGELKTLMHEQKMFMAMNMDSMKGMIESMTKSNGTADSKPVVKALGKKEKINGYDTEEYLVTQGNTVSHVWIAKDFPHYDAFLKSMKAMRDGPIGKMAPQAQMDLSVLPGMPLKTVVEIDGKPSGSSLVKSVEEKELDAADFTPPNDYKTLSLPSSPASEK